LAAANGAERSSAAGGLLHYLGHELRRSLNHVHSLRLWQREDILILDAATRRNLEIVDPLRAGGGQTTLLNAVDRNRDFGRWAALAPMAVGSVARFAPASKSGKASSPGQRPIKAKRDALQARLRKFATWKDWWRGSYRGAAMRAT